MPVTVAASERAAASALKKFGQRLGDLIMWLSRKDVLTQDLLLWRI